MSHKRKSIGPEPANKRARTENSYHHTSKQVTPRKVTDSAPPLPKINAEYEGIVFTHQSKLGVKDSTNDLKSYDRLEYLGDAYIEVIASRLIWETFKTLPTGRLSQIRESLVKNETLAQFSVTYGFDQKVRVSSHESGGTGWTKIKGDVFEAYVAAVILSDPVDGFTKAEDWLTELWRPTLQNVDTRQTNLMAKEELARRVLVPGVRLNYVDERPTVQKKGSGIATYFLGVYLTGWGYENQHLGSGKAQNKVAAGNEAAAHALDNHPLIDQIVAKRMEWLDAREAAKGSESKEA